MTHTAQLRVGITQRHLPAEPTRFARDALDSAWYDWLQQELGDGRFLPIPNFADAHALRRYVDSWGLNALILSGGQDIGMCPLRDRQEFTLCRWAEDAAWPVFGVCRGMQVLHSYAGGSLHAVDAHCAAPHRVNSAGLSAVVNSWHRWRVSEPDAQWEVLARAEDGSVEAMRHRQRPWLGLMWHPEREHNGDCLWRPWWNSMLQPISTHPS